GTYFLIGGLSFIAKESWNGNKYQINYIKHNTAFLTDSKSNILGRYNKIKLLLFGEYFPQINSKLGFIKKIIPAVGDLTPGEELNLLEVKEKELRIGTLICYEDIIPYFGREFANKGSNLLINLTNDAWFGKSTAPYQHLLVSIPRAVETRRYFIRSTNSGVSAIISPTGLVENKSGIFTKENLQGDVALVNSYKTLYSKVGDIFPWISLLFLVLYFFTRHLIRKYSF
ncbi:MAG: apolipoprotein N-acyltransferase, partial [Candidatus Dadabacteria bacterium]|nr:apolipoprotein N-acyltransferase [Candidatus Dadabacteria bacterium]NIQ13549.1 apolipoprotein N-acyltransferase [Candidatus Dadabacteria bacterium]